MNGKKIAFVFLAFLLLLFPPAVFSTTSATTYAPEPAMENLQISPTIFSPNGDDSNPRVEISFDNALVTDAKPNGGYDKEKASRDCATDAARYAVKIYDASGKYLTSLKFIPTATDPWTKQVLEAGPYGGYKTVVASWCRHYTAWYGGFDVNTKKQDARFPRENFYTLQVVLDGSKVVAKKEVFSTQFDCDSCDDGAYCSKSECDETSKKWMNQKVGSCYFEKTGAIGGTCYPESYRTKPMAITAQALEQRRLTQEAEERVLNELGVTRAQAVSVLFSEEKRRQRALELLYFELASLDAVLSSKEAQDSLAQQKWLLVPMLDPNEKLRTQRKGIAKLIELLESGLTVQQVQKECGDARLQQVFGDYDYAHISAARQKMGLRALLAPYKCVIVENEYGTVGNKVDESKDVMKETRKNPVVKLIFEKEKQKKYFPGDEAAILFAEAQKTGLEGKTDDAVYTYFKIINLYAGNPETRKYAALARDAALQAAATFKPTQLQKFSSGLKAVFNCLAGLSDARFMPLFLIPGGTVVKGVQVGRLAHQGFRAYVVAAGALHARQIVEDVRSGQWSAMSESQKIEYGVGLACSGIIILSAGTGLVKETRIVPDTLRDLKALTTPQLVDATQKVYAFQGSLYTWIEDEGGTWYYSLTKVSSGGESAYALGELVADKSVVDKLKALRTQVVEAQKKKAKVTVITRPPARMTSRRAEAQAGRVYVGWVSRGASSEAVEAASSPELPALRLRNVRTLEDLWAFEKQNLEALSKRLGRAGLVGDFMWRFERVFQKILKEEIARIQSWEDFLELNRRLAVFFAEKDQQGYALSGSLNKFNSRVAESLLEKERQRVFEEYAVPLAEARLRAASSMEDVLLLEQQVKGIRFGDFRWRDPKRRSMEDYESLSSRLKLYERVREAIEREIQQAASLDDLIALRQRLSAFGKSEYLLDYGAEGVERVFKSELDGAVSAAELEELQGRWTEFIPAKRDASGEVTGYGYKLNQIFLSLERKLLQARLREQAPELFEKNFVERIEDARFASPDHYHPLGQLSSIRWELLQARSQGANPGLVAELVSRVDEAIKERVARVLRDYGEGGSAEYSGVLSSHPWVSMAGELDSALDHSFDPALAEQVYAVDAALAKLVPSASLLECISATDVVRHRVPGQSSVFLEPPVSSRPGSFASLLNKRVPALAAEYSARIAAADSVSELQQIYPLIPFGGRGEREPFQAEAMVVTARFMERLSQILSTSMKPRIEAATSSIELSALRRELEFARSTFARAGRVEADTSLDTELRTRQAAALEREVRELQDFFAPLTEEEQAHGTVRVKVVGLASDVFAPYRGFLFFMPEGVGEATLEGGIASGDRVTKIFVAFGNYDGHGAALNAIRALVGEENWRALNEPNVMQLALIDNGAASNVVIRTDQLITDGRAVSAPEADAALHQAIVVGSEAVGRALKKPSDELVFLQLPRPGTNGGTLSTTLEEFRKTGFNTVPRTDFNGWAMRGKVVVYIHPVSGEAVVFDEAAQGRSYATHPQMLEEIWRELSEETGKPVEELAKLVHEDSVLKGYLVRRVQPFGELPRGFYGAVDLTASDYVQRTGDVEWASMISAFEALLERVQTEGGGEASPNLYAVGTDPLVPFFIPGERLPSLREAIGVESEQLPDVYVQTFSEGKGEQKALLGGKGAYLAEMTREGLPVPPGFTVTARAFQEYHRTRELPPQASMQVLRQHMAGLESATGKKFGGSNPLLVSVRSGARVSMPGMLETVLNIGLNDRTVQELARATGDRRFALDSYRRLLEKFGSVVLGMSEERFAGTEARVLEKYRAASATELPEAGLQELADAFKALVQEDTGKPFPQDPWVQLELAVKGVFDSWDKPIARQYRQNARIPDDIGTAVNVQAMVFGNLGRNSGTGVLFSRDPRSGSKALFLEYRPREQGEAMVGGKVTPVGTDVFRQQNPGAFRELQTIAAKGEQIVHDMADIEFTIEEGRVHVLQVRAGAAQPAASAKILASLAEEGLISREEAVSRADFSALQKLNREVPEPQTIRAISTGIGASYGAAYGTIVFDSARAQELSARGQQVILVRPETSTDDYAGIVASTAVLTTRGGANSHAGLHTRALNKPAVVGAEGISLDLNAKQMRVGDRVFHEGDVITVDGTRGLVYGEKMDLVPPEGSAAAAELLGWRDALMK
jgi:phosphohistidine swiveling domain-containing protein